MCLWPQRCGVYHGYTLMPKLRVVYIKYVQLITCQSHLNKGIYKEMEVSEIFRSLKYLGS